ncbi:a23eb2fe-fd64-4186-9394-8e73a75781b4-CDS [Sclerotinia trifoliorum]|uniref:A23eb2fe-fd64-4186-9394-8e73a75781b4-CDS n=1 Tax=Sclerotinia trifoliorum TaxID=28548 RepID=A0A8H2VYZ3_9HELO|nr:a23eb2fe-fd64-4186-9394-8e73a75781b4-CDS [Sclerotinia trifoliorum]
MATTGAKQEKRAADPTALIGIENQKDTALERQMNAEGEDAEICVAIGDKRVALAEAKSNWDIAERKGADTISLKRSRRGTPGFLKYVDISSNLNHTFLTIL